eukprot:5591511-Prymnesium_polylepis.2
MPDDYREVVVMCHDVPAAVAEGRFELNNLRAGHVDAFARCASSALFVSHGVRRSTRLWLVLRELGITVCLDGATCKSLSPDERSIAAAIKRALHASAHPELGETITPGWAVFREDSLESRMRTLLFNDATTLAVLHELGAPLSEVLRDCGLLREEDRPAVGRDGGGGSSMDEATGATRAATVLVVGDSQGFTKEEETLLFDALKGRPARVGRVPLLGSHSIVLAHAVMDEHANGD